MHSLYNFSTFIASKLILLSPLFSPKMSLFVKGRKSVIDTIKSTLKKGDKTIWFHCASLGEYEQGVPIIKKTKEEFPDHKIIVSFFSPSGFEVKKNDKLADCTVYLPLDTPKNAKNLIDLLQPSVAIFIKYEFWPNYLFELKKKSIPTILVSGLFRKDQVFFKFYGGFMRRTLNSFSHFFVQDQLSKNLLEQLKISQVSVSGDTRFDRVSDQLSMNNELDFMALFKQDLFCLVCGSTWPKDESILINYINNFSNNTKFIIAPHEVNNLRVESLKKKLKVKTVLYSEIEKYNISDYQVLIIDTVGLLTKVYSYADVAYIGGGIGMGANGLHNILEAATFGVPIIIGENYTNFPEAKKLKKLNGLFSVATPQEFIDIFNQLKTDAPFCEKTGLISKNFILNNRGATDIILNYLQQLQI
ncbi:MAG: 3-deoxy-D-manno-octulosonic acid transferase [Flavobacteriaceae bacterium]|nr:3-deoxy-D-manno-octulosonic acid transferase [Flavobacteriaceae bacterium]